MPNANYVSGRAFEYARKTHYEELGYKVMRTAGSHGEFDLIVYRPQHKPMFVQCKIVTTEKQASTIIKEFTINREAAAHYHQRIDVKIKRARQIKSWTL